MLYISFWFPAGGGTGVQRTVRLVRQLARLGWETIVLSGPPDDPRDQPAVEARVVPVDSPFPRRAGPPAVATAATPRSGRGPEPSRLRRLLRDLAFIPDPQVYWVPGAVRAARRIHAETPLAAMICSAPPFSTFLVGAWLKARLGLPLVLDYRDVWLEHPWWPRSPWRSRLEARLERAVQRRADLIVANHDAMAGLLRRRHPRISPALAVVPNGFDPEELGAPVRPGWRAGEMFTMVYAGTLYGPRDRDAGREDALSVQRPDGLFAALRLLIARRRFGSGGARVTFIGAAPESPEGRALGDCARRHGLEDVVETVPRLDKAGLVPRLRSAHVLLNLLYHTEAQVAQKIYEYMHLEIPVLSLLRDSPPSADLATRSGCGPIADPADTEAIAAAIEGILRRYESGEPLAVDRDFIDTFDARRQAGILSERIAALSGHPRP